MWRRCSMCGLGHRRTSASPHLWQGSERLGEEKTKLVAGGPELTVRTVPLWFKWKAA
jgi:hypothetical protein